MPTPAQQQAAGAGDQLNSTVGHSPFARPGSRAGASTVPATLTETPLASISPFTRLGSHAGSARSDVDFPKVAPSATRPSNCNSPISSISDSMFPEDLNTSTSWDLIDPDCDVEVTGITKGQTQPQVDQMVNTNTDSTPAKPDRGLEQVSDISLNQNLGTLYNQDFFVADTTGRWMSTQVIIMPFIVTEYKRCQFHPNSIQPWDTGNCYKQFKMMSYDLVSIHHSL